MPMTMKARLYSRVFRVMIQAGPGAEQVAEVVEAAPGAVEYAHGVVDFLEGQQDAHHGDVVVDEQVQQAGHHHKIQGAEHFGLVEQGKSPDKHRRGEEGRYHGQRIGHRILGLFQHTGDRHRPHHYQHNDGGGEEKQQARIAAAAHIGQQPQQKDGGTAKDDCNGNPADSANRSFRHLFMGKHVEAGIGVAHPFVGIAGKGGRQSGDNGHRQGNQFKVPEHLFPVQQVQPSAHQQHRHTQHRQVAVLHSHPPGACQAEQLLHPHGEDDVGRGGGHARSCEAGASGPAAHPGGQEGQRYPRGGTGRDHPDQDADTDLHSTSRNRSAS